MLVPLALLVSVTAALGYAARSLVFPVIEVWVVPAVAKPPSPSRSDPHSAAVSDGESRGGVVIAQAPGWIEADPYAVTIPALIDGVVREVLVLEGQTVRAGDVVARLVDDDARLSLRLADAACEEGKAEVERANAAFLAAQARAEEVRDELERDRPLVQSGVLPEGPFARLGLRLEATRREADAARAARLVAESALQRLTVACERARLALDRTEVRSPSSGIIMSRLVEPGAGVTMLANAAGSGGMGGAIARLYDPAKLQVRVDVTLADIAKIGIGTAAQITTEATGDAVFRGNVTRIVHEANIQRNTVQVKVAIAAPSSTLKPEMLARVRFVADGGRIDSGATSHAEGEPGPRFIISSDALRNVLGERAEVWIVDHGASRLGPVAALREITLAPGHEQRSSQGMVEVVAGLRMGDRVIIKAPPSLTPGSRLRVLGEPVEAGATGGSLP